MISSRLFDAGIPHGTCTRLIAEVVSGCEQMATIDNISEEFTIAGHILNAIEKGFSLYNAFACANVAEATIV